MGRLIGLELHNFKSYRGTSNIGFGTSNFTSIIGPNGAGKSNMMDAISFVLGVKSSHLRSNNVKELIYRGRISESSGDGLESDPTRAHVMAVYQKDNGEVIKLKRSITASGNSDYKINDLSVTSLNYSMVLKAENILIKARNFLVFQGDVEQIASQSPTDLTKLMENISGSAEHIKEYDELKEEHELALEYSNSVFSRKRTLNSESKQYKEQLAEQREFEDQLLQKSEIIKKINLYKLYHNEKKHNQLLDDLKDKKKHIKEVERNLSAGERALKTAMGDYSKMKLQMKKNESLLEDCASNIEMAKRELIPFDANRKSLASKIKSMKSKLNDLKVDCSRQKQLVADIEKQLRDAQRLFNQFQDKIAASVSSSVSSEGQREYESLRSQFLASNGSQLEEELTVLLNDKESLNANISNIKSQNANALQRIADIESEINTNLNSKLADIMSEINDTLTLKQEKIDAKNSLIKAKDDFNSQELQLNSQLRDILVRLDELSSQQRESNKQKKLRENVSMLRNLFPKGAIKGVVNDLVRPSKHKYEAALLTILGRNFDSIIVETTAVAYKCVEILKERRSGIATFIPLDSVISDSLNLNYLRTIHELAQPGIDILEYDDKSLEQAINYVVGNAMVIDNIEVARRLKWDSQFKLDNKLVTLDGSVIHKSGLMTGGQQTQKLAAGLSWDKNEWNKLQELRDELTSKLSTLQDSRPKELEINAIAEEIGLIDDRIPVLRNQKINVERAIADRKSEISFQKELSSSFEESIAVKTKAINKLDGEIYKLQSHINNLQDKIYSEFCSKYGFKNGIDDYENLHGSTLRVRAKERAQFVKAISTLSNRLIFEKEGVEDTEKRQVLLNEQINKFEQEMVKLLAAKQEKEIALDKFEAESEVMQSEADDYNKKVQSKMKLVKTQESIVSEINSKLSSLIKDSTQLEEQSLKIDSERVNILKNCKINSVNIPLKDGLLETVPISDSTEKLVKEAYSIEVDYLMLEEKYKSSLNSKIEAELESLLQKTIDNLEKLTPNAKAIERLKEVDSKLKAFDRDHTLARQKERKLADKFQDIRATRHQKFMEAFDHISGKIDLIYKELTKSATSPLGGSAYLTLEDEDSPYNSGIKYHAMPPMKRFRDMDLLSGGEKTMAALALLFAIHSYQPAPFFVLDEVDAALDNSNVGKIANYIKTHAGPKFQFIVISLKNSLFEKSDALVGIYREQREITSKTVTLDLREYPEDEIPLSAIPA